MATQLKEYQFIHAGRRGAKYDWNRWFDGKPWRLTRGKDFAIETRVFQSGASLAASKRGLRAYTAVEDENTIVIQAVPRDGSSAAKQR